MKRVICIVLCLAMLSGFMTTAFAAGDDVITGEFHYLASAHFLSGSDPSRSFRYSDSYFDHSGYQYDHELAKMTMDLCASADATTHDGWETSNKNFIELVQQCGFTDIDCNYYVTHGSTPDSIGVNMASRKLDDCTLLAVAVRGHNYGSEWASNFTVGAEGGHQGFSEARDQVLDYIKEYIDVHGVTGRIKIWLTGYSRSAATANLVGGAIDQGFDFGDAVSFDLNDLYCYTFEAPQGTADPNCRDELYNNVHNFVNRNDLVVYVSLAEWGHSRYGIDYYLPCRQNDGAYYYELKPQVDAIFRNTDLMTLGCITLDLIDDFHYLSLNPLTTLKKQDMTQDEFYQEFIDLLLEEIPDREYFVENLQSDMREIGAVLLGNGTDSLPAILIAFAQKMLALDNIMELYTTLTCGSKKAYEQAIELVEEIFMEALREAGNASYNSAQAKELVHKTVMAFIRLFIKAPDTMLTLLVNILPILNAHFPEMGRIWMEVTPAEFFFAQGSGYIDENACTDGHRFADEWSVSETEHWHAAICGHDEKAELGEHSDENCDHLCDVCGYAMSECADGDGDHVCDLCGTVLYAVELNVKVDAVKSLVWGVPLSYTYVLKPELIGADARLVQYSLDGGKIWLTGTVLSLPKANYSFSVRILDSTGAWTGFAVKNGTEVTHK